jgi:signal transduction histidine kinase
MTPAARGPNLGDMQFFRPNHTTRPNGILLLRERLGGSERDRTRFRAWPVFSMLLILVSGVIGTPAPALHGDGFLTLVGGGTIVALIVIEIYWDPQSDRANFATCLALGLASIVLMLVQPSGTAVIGTYAAVASAVIRLPRRLALAAVIPIIVLVDLLVVLGSDERGLVLAWTSIAYAFMFVIGHLVRLSEEHQSQAQALLDEEKRTREARNEAAALAERSRIAREMHDVLAHSLSALSVELEGARLLALDRDADADVIAAIGRAHRHAATGLGEARGAIEALRGDAVPGPERLAELVSQFEAHGVECRLSVEGTPRRLPSDAALAIYRTAQEALTNVRKHAEDASLVELRLDYEDGGARLVVENNAGADGAATGVLQPASLAGAGSGYGVSGMRERAELIGGRLLAGPVDGGFRVELWVPAAADAA